MLKIFAENSIPLITGKELTMKMKLNDFVKLENSVYYFLINGANTLWVQILPSPLQISILLGS